MAGENKDRGSIGKNAIRNVMGGDKVIWIIVLVLMLTSLVAIFSSTSTMAIQKHTSRFNIFLEQLTLVLCGGVLIFACAAVPNIKFFRWMGKIGFMLSLALLLFLDLNLSIGDSIRVTRINGACRAISVFGFSLQVFEVVKIAMVMYLAWAVQTYESNSFKLTGYLGTRYPEVFGWTKEPEAQRWIFIFLPIVLVTVLILPGSTGSALLTAIVMFMTIIIGGVKWKDMVKPLLVGAGCILLLVGTHIVSSGKVIGRMQTAFNRVKIELPYPESEARAAQREKIALKKLDPATLNPKSDLFKEYLDEIRQPKAAEIAIAEGGRRIVGKGPGKSTQKYAVPVMFEDYMYSILVEEYGLIAGILVIWMYLCLFARGGIIVNSCQNRYAKACVGGLIFLITFQGLFHILINCNVGIVTGQTLPLISHGKCSFLCFCFAFGQILCISKMANKKIKEEQLMEQQLIAAQDTEDGATVATNDNTEK